jgi:cytochrome P450
VIPKGTIVTAQTPTIHIDPVYFDDPDCFRPERFIDANSGKFIKSDKVLPFSIGKRSCLGESIARMELFLFIASFVQKCDFRVPNGEQRPTRINVAAMGIRDPLPFNCSVIARN